LQFSALPRPAITARTMLNALALPILEAAYDLSSTDRDALKHIATAAARVVPRGSVVAACFGADAQLDPGMLHFERAPERYVRGVLAWQRATPVELRRRLLSLPPQVILNHGAPHGDPDGDEHGDAERSPAEVRALVRNLFPLCAMGNTGHGGGLHVAFGDPQLTAWSDARIRPFGAVARHLAVAWRIRTGLHGDRPPAIAGELRVDGSAVHLAPSSSAPTAREALRRAVIARERARSPRRSAGGSELWPALIAGRWSLLDAFTASGRRFIVAYENPAAPTDTRALRPHERAVLVHALEGRSGKWIALEMGRSDSAVARILCAALRRIGAADLAALAGARTALFEALDGMATDDALAMARVAPAEWPLARLSDAERDVAMRLLGGMRGAAIARERGTSPRTVANQITRIYHKLGISSRRELIAQLT
jgi:DNA-binding CsgD family transcriptional regulator